MNYLRASKLALISNCIMISMTAALPAAAKQPASNSVENHQERIARLEATVGQLVVQVEELRGALTSIEARAYEEGDDLQGGALEVCETEFAAGIYSLQSSTPFGIASPEQYELSHATMEVGRWRLNAGFAWDGYMPAGFYLDYDGDGRLDTAVTARLARELPLVGNTLADRLLADSDRFQQLYAVFGCEWQSAKFTSAEDIASGAADGTSRVWSLLASNAEELSRWIAADVAASSNP